MGANDPTTDPTQDPTTTPSTDPATDPTTPSTDPVTEPEEEEEEDALITAARGWLRIDTKKRNDEIRQVIQACLIDLKNGGVVTIDTDDAAIQQALKLYLKSQFGYDADSDKFGRAYEFLKAALALSGDYNGTTD